MNYIKYGLMLLLLLCSIGKPLANDRKVIVDIVLPSDNVALHKLVAQIENNALFTLRKFERTLPQLSARGDILVVVSDQILSLLNSSGYQASIALYTTPSEYEKHKNENSSAIFSNQPLDRQLHLINAIAHNTPTRVGIAWRDKYYKQELENAKLHFPNFTFIDTSISADEGQRRINKIIQSSDFLLATPERELYNAQSIRGILLASLRHRTPMIGPSESFVTAGALASIISKPHHYASQLRSMVHQYIDTQILSEPNYPENFDVKVNYNVAESLGIVLPDENTLKTLMQSLPHD